MRWRRFESLAFDRSMDPASLAADPAYQAAQAIINGVNEDPASKNEELAYLAGTPTVEGINQIFGATTPGGTFSLTTGLDEISITTINTADTVRGFFDGGSPASTLTPADLIEGNGNTALRLVVNLNGGNANAPFFEMSGVSTVNVVAADNGWLYMDGATYAMSGRSICPVPITSMSMSKTLTFRAGSTSVSRPERKAPSMCGIASWTV